jgi:hypothetical protein
MSDDEQMKPDDLDEQEAAVLPAREAMSLIAPDTSTPAFIPDIGAIQEAPDGTVTAQGAASDAQGSASAEESSSSQTQSTQASNQDTASSIT